MSNAKVLLWGSKIGEVNWLGDSDIGVFQYDPDFIRSGIQLSPLLMPLKEFPYEFPHLAKKTFRGLPGLLADSLPDKFGNTIIDVWLASQGRTVEKFNSVERLCFIGDRGMGGLEFETAVLEPSSNTKEIDIAKLVKISNMVLDQQSGLGGIYTENDDREAIEDLLWVGTSAGGSRAKAILAWNPITDHFLFDQTTLPYGYEHWIIKFDGISNNRDKEKADSQGYGKIEYAYYLMALEAGIEMMPSRLHYEGGRSHFMTKRFDRTAEGNKLHMQSLGAIAHFDFNQPNIYSYEQAILTMERLGLPQKDLEQQILRTLFNVVGRNQDDHVKNIAFLMNQSGEWRLSPAFDVTYAYDPNGHWTGKHQMSINGKRDKINLQDLFSLAKMGGIKSNRTLDLLDHVIKAVELWPNIAENVGVFEINIQQIQANQRLHFLK